LADLNRVTVFLNTGVPVQVAAADVSMIAVVEVGNDLNIENSAGQIIASFSKNVVAYWTTDLVAL
jgi:transcriptional regulatory protein LevR